MCVELVAVFPLVDRIGCLNFSVWFLKKFYFDKEDRIIHFVGIHKTIMQNLKNAVNFLFDVYGCSHIKKN
jgi:hypothetical protein